MKTSQILAATLMGIVAFSAFAESQYVARVPVNVKFSSAPPEVPQEPISVVLSPEALPAATVNEPYSFNLADRLSITGGTGSYNLGDVAWSLKAGDVLPAGLTLSNGTIAGTPTVKNETGASFEVTGMYQDASGQQVYTIVVGGQTLKVKQIAAGYGHTCAVTPAGGVKCWGQDYFGQLGDGGTNTDKTTPVDVLGLTSGVASVTAGYSHTCAVTISGGVKCWGKDLAGQLGDGGTNTDQTTPVDVSGLTSGVASVTAGSQYTCAVTTEGGVKCWGDDEYGQLGDGGANVNKATPVDVYGLSAGVVSVSAGSNHTCAVTTEGGAKCWGRDEVGKLGDGGMDTNQPTPVDVSGLNSGVLSVTAGYAHTCALISSGGVKCWGWDGHGQLGDGGTNTNKATPVDVQGLAAGVTSVTSGHSHVCALMSSGGVKCWGLDSSGQLGDGGTNTNQSTPVNVSGLTSGVASVTAGYYHTCAVTSSGGAKCWGNDGWSQIGDSGENVNKTTPVDVLP